MKILSDPGQSYLKGAVQWQLNLLEGYLKKDELNGCLQWACERQNWTMGRWKKVTFVGFITFPFYNMGSPKSPYLHPIKHLWDVLRSMEVPLCNLQDLKDMLLMF